MSMVTGHKSVVTDPINYIPDLPLVRVQTAPCLAMKRSCGVTNTRSWSKMPKQSKQPIQPPEPTQPLELPELPNELWRIIVKMAARDSVETASRIRLVRKYFATTLRRTQIWSAFDAVIDRRAALRAQCNRDDEANPGINDRDAMHNSMIRLAQDQGDLFLTRFYIEMCSQANTLAAARNGLVSLRLMCTTGAFGRGVTLRQSS